MCTRMTDSAERADKLYETLMAKAKEFRAIAHDEVSAEILKERNDRRESLLKHWGVTRQRSLNKEAKAMWTEYDHMYKRAMRFFSASVEHRTLTKLDAWCKENANKV
jgi:hypothetical protein